MSIDKYLWELEEKIAELEKENEELRTTKPEPLSAAMLSELRNQRRELFNSYPVVSGERSEYINKTAYLFVEIDRLKAENKRLEDLLRNSVANVKADVNTNELTEQEPDPTKKLIRWESCVGLYSGKGGYRVEIDGKPPVYREPFPDYASALSVFLKTVKDRMEARAAGFKAVLGEGDEQ